jgi:hypothetical protein
MKPSRLKVLHCDYKPQPQNHNMIEKLVCKVGHIMQTDTISI